MQGREASDIIRDSGNDGGVSTPVTLQLPRFLLRLHRYGMERS